MTATVDRPPSESGAHRVPVRSHSARWWILANLQKIGLVLTLLVMTLVFASLSPYFLTIKNGLHIGRAVAIRGIVSVGLTMVLVSGEVDLSLGAIMAASGVVCGKLIELGLPVWSVILASTSLGVAIGAVNGFFVTRVGIKSLIATLGMMSIVRGLCYVISDGRDISIRGDSFKVLARGQVLGMPNPLLIWLVVCLVSHLVLQYTRFGHYAFAIGGNAHACRVSGVKVDRYKTGVFMLSAGLAGFAGSVLASLSGTGVPSAAEGAELDIFAAVVLGGASMAGGTGSIVGTVLGTLVVGFINNGFTLIGMKPYWQIVTRGAVLMLAVALDSLRTGRLRRRR